MKFSKASLGLVLVTGCLSFADLAFASGALAVTVGPAVGDSATYALSVQDSSTSPLVSYLNRMDVLSINPLLHSANLQQTLTQNGAVLSQNAYDQALTDIGYFLAADLQNCATLADANTTASLESVRVKAGTFQSCHLKSIAADSDGNLSDIYLGVVPFGTLKSVSTNPTTGAIQSMELQSYRKN